MTLLVVVLVPDFFTNTISLPRFTRKGVHWDAENQHLHCQDKTFCHMQRIGTHWALEFNSLPTSTSISAFASALITHSGPEINSHLRISVAGAIDLNSTSNSTSNQLHTPESSSASNSELPALDSANS